MMDLSRDPETMNFGAFSSYEGLLAIKQVTSLECPFKHPKHFTSTTNLALVMCLLN